jgi:hypothetical protein
MLAVRWLKAESWLSSVGEQSFQKSTGDCVHIVEVHNALRCPNILDFASA